MNIKTLSTVFVLLFAGFQPSVQALGLGNIELKSYINQKLHIRIPLVFSEESELDDLKLNIILPDAGAQVWHRLEVEMVNDAEESPYLKISSKDTVHEPILSFTLKMTWSGGHIQRNYALLIDLKP